jgi:predicted GH43/DUF377 family glycosyl hydrolase
MKGEAGGVSMKLQRYEKNPILSPNPANEWESAVATNPGAWYDESSRKVYLLYRAAGHDVEHRIHLGLAVSGDGRRFERVSERPVFSPSRDGFDAGCVEDPRIVKIGDWFYVTYACRAFPPGQYWLPADKRPYRRAECPPDFPKMLRQNHTATGLALTKDFKTWIRAGRLTDPVGDDRDVILFPEKVEGKYVMVHRPMRWTGVEYGTEHPAMWISFSDDLLSFGKSKLLMKGKYDWERKVGGNTPPIRTPHGWLMIYHGLGMDLLYRLGAVLLDLEDPSIVLHRTPDWILQPEQKYELEGYYKGVVFPCGSVVIDGTLFVYYGGADNYVGLATCPLGALVDHLLECPE